MLFYLIQRTDCTSCTLAEDIDPTYAQTFREARKAGLEVLAYDCEITPEGITLNTPVPFSFD